MRRNVGSNCAESPITRRKHSRIILLALASVLALGALCERGDSSESAWGGPAREVTVELTTVVPEFLRDVVALTGQLEAENAIVLKPEISGVIASIEFEEGQAVHQNDVLFRLRDDEQRARLHVSEAGLRLAQDVFERTQRLTRQDVSSLARRAEAAAKLDEARARIELTQLELVRTHVAAPFDGVAGLRHVSLGDRVTPDDGLVELLAIDRLQLVFTVQEVGIGLARTGVLVAARVAAWPGERFPGEVFFVAPSLDPAARRLVLKAWIANDDHRLKPGMFANVDVEIARKEGAILVPEAAVVYDRNGIYVWRVNEEGRAEKVPVEIGLRQSARVEVVRGLSSGDAVVSAGTHKVMAGSILRDVYAAPPEPAEPTHARDKSEADSGRGEES